MTDYSNFDKWCSDAHFVRLLFSKLRKFPNELITRPSQLYDFRKNKILPQNLIQTILRKYVLIFRSLAISLPSINAKCSRTWVLQNKGFSAVSLVRLLQLELLGCSLLDWIILLLIWYEVSFIFFQNILVTIPILGQQRDWVGEVRNMAIFADVPYYLVFMLT